VLCGRLCDTIVTPWISIRYLKPFRSYLGVPVLFSHPVYVILCCTIATSDAKDASDQVWQWRSMYVSRLRMSERENGRAESEWKSERENKQESERYSAMLLSVCPNVLYASYAFHLYIMYNLYKFNI